MNCPERNYEMRMNFLLGNLHEVVFGYQYVYIFQIPIIQNEPKKKP